MLYTLKSRKPAHANPLSELYQGVSFAEMTPEHSVRRLVSRDLKITPIQFLGLDNVIQQTRNEKIKWIFDQNLLLSEPKLMDVKFLACSILDRVFKVLYQKNGSESSCWEPRNLNLITSCAFFVAAKHEGYVFSPAFFCLGDKLIRRDKKEDEPKSKSCQILLNETPKAPLDKRQFWHSSKQDFQTIVESKCREFEERHIPERESLNDVFAKEMEVLKCIDFQILAPTMISLFYNFVVYLNLKRLLGSRAFQSFEKACLQHFKALVQDYQAISHSCYCSFVTGVISLVMEDEGMKKVEVLKVKTDMEKIQKSFGIDSWIFNMPKPPKNDKKQIEHAVQNPKKSLFGFF